MPDWDASSPQLQANLRRVALQIAGEARQRRRPDVETARLWHRTLMEGLDVPDPRYVGAFRGEPGVERVEVGIRDGDIVLPGVPAGEVREVLTAFGARLFSLIDLLDDLIAPGQEIRADQLKAVLDACAWVHAEWVRIHPFVNGNGRTARLWANLIAMRYGLPAFVRLRPRPRGGYGPACAAAMAGEWKATIPVFQRAYAEYVAGEPL